MTLEDCASATRASFIIGVLLGWVLTLASIWIDSKIRDR